MADKIGAKTLSQIQGSTDIMYTDRRRFYLRESMLSSLWESVTPFTNFSARLNTITGANDVNYRMFEYRPYFVDTFMAFQDESGTDTFTAGTSITAFNIDNGDGTGTTPASRVGTVVEIWNTGSTTKKCVAIITVVTSTSSTDDVVSFTPIWVASGGAAAAQNDEWHVIGTASEEGQRSPAAFSDDVEKVENSSQEFETSVQISDRAKLANMRPVNEWARMLDTGWKAHKLKIERSLLLNQRKGSTSSSADVTGEADHIVGANSERMTTTAGVEAILQDHGADPAQSRLFSPVKATYTYADMVDDFIQLAYYMEDVPRVFAFCGPGALGFWDKASVNGFIGDNARVNLEPSHKTEFGFEARRLYTNEIIVDLVRTPVLRGRYTDYMYIVPPTDNIGIVKYAPDRHDTNIQENDARSRKDRYFSDLGLWMTLVDKFGRFIFS